MIKSRKILIPQFEIFNNPTVNLPTNLKKYLIDNLFCKANVFKIYHYSYLNNKENWNKITKKYCDKVRDTPNLSEEFIKNLNITDYYGKI
jgi:hypothetical protein